MFSDDAIDVSTLSVFSATISIDILYDATSEHGGQGFLVPRIPKTEMSLGGLRFSLFAEANVNPESTRPYGIFLKMNSECEKALASGVGIGMKLVVTWTSAFGSEHVLEDQLFNFVPGEQRQLLNFDESVAHDELNFELTLTDVHPYRHHFVEKEYADKLHSDFRLVVKGQEDTPLYVHKTILSLHSEFFYVMLNREFVEKNQDEVELENLTVDELLEYLYCVYPPCRPFHFKRMGTILRLADRFGNDILLREAQKFLISITALTEMKFAMMEWADTYRLTALFKHVLDGMTKEETKALVMGFSEKLKAGNKQILLLKLATFL